MATSGESSTDWYLPSLEVLLLQVSTISLGSSITTGGSSGSQSQPRAPQALPQQEVLPLQDLLPLQEVLPLQEDLPFQEDLQLLREVPQVLTTTGGSGSDYHWRFSLWFIFLTSSDFSFMELQLLPCTSYLIHKVWH